MIVLRALLTAAGATVAMGSVVMGRPAVFLLLAPACLILFFVGCGLAASDAIPLRPLPLAASLLAAVGGVVVVTGADRAVAVAIGVAITGLQIAAWWRGSPRVPA